MEFIFLKGFKFVPLFLLTVFNHIGRVGVASFISLLIQRVGADIKPFISLLVRVLFAAVKEEKSASSKRAFANACGSVLKHATSSQAEKLIEETAALHTGDKNAQLSCAVLIKSFASVAPDVISGYYGELLPIVYMSRYLYGLFYMVARLYLAIGMTFKSI